ncbi:MAG: VOC family protein [Actinomycetota bacterium]|nr:VOC family protein [Actinomycetota bacterium]
MLEVERVDFIGVPVRDVARAREFYGETLGLAESTAPDDRWPEFETGNVTLGIFEPERVGRPFAPSPAPIALRVADVGEARLRLEDGGVTFEGDIFDSGVCHTAFFQDPDGNALMLHRRYAPPRGFGDARG